SPTISADGSVVAFEARGSNLITGDSNGVEDIFVHDRATGITDRVSVDSFGAQANADSRNAVISSDGRWIAFESNANNLVTGDTNWASDIFVHDRATGSTDRVSLD